MTVPRESGLRLAAERDASDETDSDPLADLIGRSTAMSDLRRHVTVYGPSPHPIVLYGETGAGKELVARAVHHLGRAGRPFVAVNCGALAELAEARLFGHVRGSFTGAHSDASGILQDAADGTLFLDEIADLPRLVQPILLRALDGHEYRALGGREPKRLRARIVVASNVDLSTRVWEGRFREDLFHRLATHVVRVPPLSERMVDVPELVAAFAAGSHLRCSFTSDAISYIQAQSWPGNVRQLKAYVDNAAPCAVDGVVDAAILHSIDALPEPSVAKTRAPGTYKQQMDAFERAVLEEALRTAGHNRTAAAAALGMPRATFVRLARAHGLIHRESEASKNGRPVFAGAALEQTKSRKEDRVSKNGHPKS